MANDKFKDALMRRLKTWVIAGEEGINVDALLDFMEWDVTRAKELSLFNHLQYAYDITDNDDLGHILECLLLEVNVVRTASASSIAALKWLRAQYSVSTDDGALLVAVSKDRISTDEMNEALKG